MRDLGFLTGHVTLFYLLFFFRYRPEPQSRQPRSWTEITDITKTEYILDNLLHGEQYEIEVDAVSHHVLSGKPMSTFQIIDPKSIDNLQPILGQAHHMFSRFLNLRNLFTKFSLYCFSTRYIEVFFEIKNAVYHNRKMTLLSPLKNEK